MIILCITCAEDSTPTDFKKIKTGVPYTLMSWCICANDCMKEISWTRLTRCWQASVLKRRYKYLKEF